ncbi:hypothetical protein E8P77_31955 [Soehngenia saccharolytica]|nr:hypothetical protein E8P77_31955 [Soehngenia saccharolytica]
MREENNPSAAAEDGTANGREESFNFKPSSLKTLMKSFELIFHFFLSQMKSLNNKFLSDEKLE